MNNIIETEDWKLSCYMEWRPKSKKITCPTCLGKGETGGHFKDLDGPQICNSCWGTKIKIVHAEGKPPELPPKLREHMRRAWFDFLHSEQND